MKIPIEITTLENEQPVEVIEAFIYLGDDFINYKTEFYANVRDGDDPLMPLEEDCYQYLDEIISKDAITGIYLSWRRKIGQWKILISASGVNDDIYLMFTDAIKAKSVFKKIKEWKYGSQ